MSSLVLSGDTSGTVTMSVPSISGTNTVSVQAGTGTMSLNTLMTAQASTSGTSIDFTSIPSWVKRITVMFGAVSVSGTTGATAIIVQIGTSGGVQNTGYSGSGGIQSTSPVTVAASQTTGFNVSAAGLGAYVVSGNLIINLLNSATGLWVASGSFGYDNNYLGVGGGSKTLSGTLDRVRITTVNGTDTFDAGSINVLYEG